MSVENGNSPFTLKNRLQFLSGSKIERNEQLERVGMQKYKKKNMFKICRYYFDQAPSYLEHYIRCAGSRGSLVSILRTGRPGDRGSIPDRGKRIFPLISVSRPAQGSIQPRVHWEPGVVPRRQIAAGA
jgi:hypothetical protein